MRVESSATIVFLALVSACGGNDSDVATGGEGGTSSQGGASNSGGSTGAEAGSGQPSGGTAGSAGNAGSGASGHAGSGAAGNGGTVSDAGTGRLTLIVTPSSATIAEKGTQTFTCNHTCTWSVQEGAAGGTITPAGLYTAPATFGTYHVVATDAADALTATATVIVPQPAMGTPGQWENVTSPNMPTADFTDPNNAFGIGNIVADPARPSDIYAGGYGTLWKSIDYGLTWSEINSNPKPGSLPLGHAVAVAGTMPTATMWVANSQHANGLVYRSTNAGVTFTVTGKANPMPTDVLYSIAVDPNDPTHLVSGLHEIDGALESTDSGDNWHWVSSVASWPSGGISWFVFFVNTGDPATTRKTWFAIAQNGASAIMTSDAGATWTIPTGLKGLQHPHGNAQIAQNGSTLFAAGDTGPGGSGVYRSTDLGANWSQVYKGGAAVVWGSTKNMYSMYAWACEPVLGCKGANYQTAPQPGTTWSSGTVPNGLYWGPNSVAVTSDGTHNIYIGAMWSAGIWRYVEP